MDGNRLLASQGSEFIWTAPDYNNAKQFIRSRVFDYIFIAPENGYIHIAMGTEDRSIYVNNHKYHITGQYMSSIFLPLTKGDTIKIEDCIEATFVPCRK